MSDATMEAIRKSRQILGNPYAHLDGEGGFSALPARAEAENYHIPSRLELENPYAYQNGSGGFDTEEALEVKPAKRVDIAETIKQSLRGLRGKPAEAARRLQEAIWRDREAIWPDGVPEDPVAMLDPEIAIRSIGFDFFMEETLGQFVFEGEQFEVAGIIDRDRNTVRLSRQLPFVTRRFTAAHELGHALMHEQTGLHRDRPLDGSSNAPRSKTEVEADQFASCYLMPENLVRSRFGKIFGTKKFVLDDTARFFLETGGVNVDEKCTSLRGLARVLASIQTFSGRHFDSLANQFHVSIEAMAIRLEELGLICWQER
ncbi:MAG TPA: ImmA/IrrE family metallo-endopeptidase [Devosia sp.]|nr:ImmA/IrrE family metallo-endopeptidase [Devosia sp.]